MSDPRSGTENVSRETPPRPPQADALAGGRVGLLQSYADLLGGAGVQRGLIGPRELPRLWERHLLNCAVVAPVVPHGASVCDVGSGAGLPGLVWAVLRPDLQVTLLEPLLRRTVFLGEVVESLGLSNVDVVRARAEDHGSGAYDVVASRAVAPLDRLARWCLPLVAVGGCMVAMKGAAVADEVATARTVIRRLGGGEPVINAYGAGVLDEVARAVVIVRERRPSTDVRPAAKGRRR